MSPTRFSIRNPLVVSGIAVALCLFGLFAYTNLGVAIAPNVNVPQAVVTTCTDLGTAPGAGTHFADFQKVDQLLDASEQSIRQSFETSPELAVDRHLQAVDDLVASWSINSARDLAWQNALVLGALRPDPAVSGLFLDGLAATTALASRLLLTAV